MGEIALTRVDARLVHGQVAARWIKFLSISKIVVVDDLVASDTFMVELFKLACPPNTVIECLNTEDAVKSFNEDRFGEGKVFLLFKDIKSCAKAYEAGLHFDEVDLGNAPGGEDRIHCSETFCMSPDEYHLVKGLEDDGVKVYFRQVPDSPETPLSSVAAKFK